MRKSPKSFKGNIFLILAGIVLTVYLTAIQPTTDSGKLNPAVDAENSPYRKIDKVEIPAKITGRAEQIITHLGYTVSYNSDRKIPNWVAYELTKEEVDGTTPRSNNFVPDPEVPYDKSATNDDYKNSGMDRGHMAPAGDMKWSRQAMKESFYLSNICPQNKNLNSGVWKDLEEQIRGLALQKGSIYVVCGPIVSKRSKTIGVNKVVVPDAFFKALLQYENGNYHAIAFVFANESGHKPLATYAMSVEELQTIADIDFFPALPDSIEKTVESRVDFTKWNIRRNNF